MPTFLQLAPVRGGEASNPMCYPWSSHRAYCGRGKVVWLSTDRTLLQVEETGIRALMKFHSYVNESLERPPPIDFSRRGNSIRASSGMRNSSAV